MSLVIDRPIRVAAPCNGKSRPDSSRKWAMTGLALADARWSIEITVLAAVVLADRVTSDGS
jgi:hypothetical protein